MTPETIRAQARAASALVAAVARYLREPEPAPSARARQAQITAAEAALAAGRAVAELPKGRADWRAVSRALAELCVDVGRAFEEAGRFEAATRGARLMAQPLAEAARGLAEGLGQGGPKGCETLAAAKSKALEVELIHREARAQAHEDPGVVRGLKSEAVCRRLSSAAEAVHRAADAFVERLAAES